MTGKHKFDLSENEEFHKKPGRFAGKAGQMYRDRFWKKEVFDSVEKV